MKLISYLTALMNSKGLNWSKLAVKQKLKSGVTIRRRIEHAIKNLNEVLNEIGYEIWIKEIEKKIR